MITLYIPSTQTFTAVNGSALSDPLLLQANLLIELRALGQMWWDMQRGISTQTVEQYRSDVVNDAKNPNI